MILRQHSTGLIATVSDPDKAREFERSLTVQKIVETAIPISIVLKNTNPGDLERTLDIQLTRLVESLNLKWNLSPGQIKTIVEDLIDKYKNESLEDFILVFKKARQGEFGELYRLDSAVIFNWMELYLAEKYEALEAKLMKQKDNIYKPIEKDKDYDPDKHKQWLDKLAEICKPDNKIPGMAEDYIKKHGQEDPAKRPAHTRGYAYFHVRGLQVYASSQEHAEKLIEGMLERGEVEEDI